MMNNMMNNLDLSKSKNYLDRELFYKLMNEHKDADDPTAEARDKISVGVRRVQNVKNSRNASVGVLLDWRLRDPFKYTR